MLRTIEFELYSMCMRVKKKEDKDSFVVIITSLNHCIIISFMVNPERSISNIRISLASFRVMENAATVIR